MIDTSKPARFKMGDSVIVSDPLDLNSGAIATILTVTHIGLGGWKYTLQFAPEVKNPYHGTGYDEPSLSRGIIGVRMACPKCETEHIDEGEWATRPHHTHLCLNPACGNLWRPSETIYFVGIRGIESEVPVRTELTADFKRLTGFTDQLPRLARAKDQHLPWGGRVSHFRCRMCGHSFKEFDYYRWVRFNTLPGKVGRAGNPLICIQCDGPDLQERWEAHCAEGFSDKYWWFRENPR